MSKILKNISFTNVNKSNKIFTPHFHNTYSMGITHKGLYKSINQNNTFDFYAYSTRINNPQELHSGNSQSWDNHYLYPNIELIQDLYFEIYYENKIPIFESHIIKDIILYKKLYKVFRSFYLKKDKLILETYIVNALSYLIINHCQKAKSLNNYFDNTKIISQSLEFINDSLNEIISLDNLASNVKLSKYHFLRVFKKELGITPHQYILNQKIENAKNFISKGYSIIDAALEVGFNDQSHFNRNFKRFYDYSPTLLIKNRNFIL